MQSWELFEPHQQAFDDFEPGFRLNAYKLRLGYEMLKRHAFKIFHCEVDWIFGLVGSIIFNETRMLV